MSRSLSIDLACLCAQLREPSPGGLTGGQIDLVQRHRVSSTIPVRIKPMTARGPCTPGQVAQRLHNRLPEPPPTRLVLHPPGRPDAAQCLLDRLDQ
ncbi:MAG TPA: hypothetical protein VGF67_27085, partial [Ktedonobacteraceae bacterium]